MSLLPPAPPRFGSPGQEEPQGVSDWRYLFKFFFQLCRYLVNLANAVQSPIAGATSGRAFFTQAFQGTSLSIVLIYCDALNGAASYTFPSPFTYAPVVVTTSGPAPGVVTALSATAVTVTGAPTTGFLVLIGF